MHVRPLAAGGCLFVRTFLARVRPRVARTHRDAGGKRFKVQGGGSLRPEEAPAVHICVFVFPRVCVCVCFNVEATRARPPIKHVHAALQTELTLRKKEK